MCYLGGLWNLSRNGSVLKMSGFLFGWCSILPPSLEEIHSVVFCVILLTWTIIVTHLAVTMSSTFCPLVVCYVKGVLSFFFFALPVFPRLLSEINSKKLQDASILLKGQIYWVGGTGMWLVLSRMAVVTSSSYWFGFHPWGLEQIQCVLQWRTPSPRFFFKAAAGNKNTWTFSTVSL